VTQGTLIDDGHMAKLERDREFGVDYTPGAVAMQILTRLSKRFVEAEGRKPTSFVDTCAGGGVFGQQARKLWCGGANAIGPTQIGIEPRKEEFGACRHYDKYIVGRAEDIVDIVDDTLGGGTIDITATNPDFKIWPTILRLYLPRSRWVMLYGTISWGCSEEGAAVFAEFPPFACDRVVGRVHHRGPGLNPETGKPWGADQRDVCCWTWRRGVRHAQPDGMPVWTTTNLPALSSAERKWLVKPGSEP
jgi:hypothetical protein